jgi:hypothetical protein
MFSTKENPSAINIAYSTHFFTEVIDKKLELKKLKYLLVSSKKAIII